MSLAVPIASTVLVTIGLPLDRSGDSPRLVSSNSAFRQNDTRLVVQTVKLVSQAWLFVDENGPVVRVGSLQLPGRQPSRRCSPTG